MIAVTTPCYQIKPAHLTEDVLGVLCDKTNLSLLIAMAAEPCSFAHLRTLMPSVSGDDVFQAVSTLKRCGLIKVQERRAAEDPLTLALTPLGDEFAGLALQIQVTIAQNMEPLLMSDLGRHGDEVFLMTQEPTGDDAASPSQAESLQG
jgi:DNA-binding HxlR family transcriptional regulator